MAAAAADLVHQVEADYVLAGDLTPDQITQVRRIDTNDCSVGVYVQPMACLRMLVHTSDYSTHVLQLKCPPR